jgi:hypothetical protein
MKKIIIALTIVFGVGVIILGGMDDSPGAQLLGLVAVAGGILGIVKSMRKASKL